MAALAASISDSATTSLPLTKEGEDLSSNGTSRGRSSRVRWGRLTRTRSHSPAMAASPARSMASATPTSLSSWMRVRGEGSLG